MLVRSAHESSDERDEYEVNVENPEHVGHGVRQVTLDTSEVAGSVIPLVDDEQVQMVTVVVGNSRPLLRVLLADHQPRVLQSLGALLTALPWSAPNRSDFPIEIVGEEDQNSHTVERVEMHEPDVVLMDLSVPESASFGADSESHTLEASSGLETIRAIKRRWPKVRVVVFTMYANDRAAAMRAGADAFLLKGCPTNELLAAIKPVAFVEAA